MNSKQESLYAAIARFIRDGGGCFNDLALELFTRQFELSAPLRTFYTAKGVFPKSISCWEDIPPVPINAFKTASLSCLSPEACVLKFESSGTTQQHTSKHWMCKDGEKLYQESLTAGFKRRIGSSCGMPIWSLIPTFDSQSNSSLSYMVKTLMTAFPHTEHRVFPPEGGGYDELANALQRLIYPVILFGTAFAWLLFFEQTGIKVVLPDKSLLIETGGFKGKTREASRDELYTLFYERLGLERPSCLAEYGMCELASQYYTYSPPLADFAPPPWLRCRVISPVTMTDVKEGETGLLAHYDIANYNSALAILTDDIGIRTDKGFILLGRSPKSELRGCSLTAEELYFV